MHGEIVVLRLVHIAMGVFWAGAVFFFVLFVEPSVRAAGPDGFKVMLGLKQRRWLDVLPTTGALTILAGFRLYWIQSSGFTASWVNSGPGMAYAAGGVVSLIALLIGIFVVRRVAMQIFALAATLPQQPEGPARDGVMAEMGALRQRNLTAARIVGALLAVTVITMAIGRYL